MTYQDFRRLVMDAEECETLEGYMAEIGGSVPVSVPDRQVIPLLTACWDYAHDRSARGARKISGLSRAAFAREYHLPIRTLENWEADENANARRAPGYVLDLLASAVIQAIAEARIDAE